MSVLAVAIDALIDCGPACAAPQQARLIDAGHFHLGGRRGPVRGPGHRLVGRRLCDRRTCGSTLIETARVIDLAPLFERIGAEHSDRPKAVTR